MKAGHEKSFTLACHWMENESKRTKRAKDKFDVQYDQY
jgi:hypothetical protein